MSQMSASELAATVFEYSASQVQPSTLGWFATLFVHSASSGIVLCGGVVVDARWIATAGHCIAGADAVTVYPASLGAGWWPAPAGSLPSLALVVDPAWSASSADAATHDVALVRVAPATPLTTASVDWDGSRWAALPDRAPLLSAGHGLDCGVGDCTTQQLLVAHVPKVATERCVGYSNSTWMPQQVGASVCAGYEGVRASPQPCHGDSGGPLYDAAAVYALVSRGDDSLGCGGSLRPTLFAPLWLSRGFESFQVSHAPPASPPPHSVRFTQLRSHFAAVSGASRRARQRRSAAAVAAAAWFITLALIPWRSSS